MKTYANISWKQLLVFCLLYPCYQPLYSGNETTPQHNTAPELGTGIILIASHHMKDTNFAKSVILITDYGESGTAGLILNKPSDLQVNDHLPQGGSLFSDDDYFYHGGPVYKNYISMIINPEDMDNNIPGRLIFNNVYLADLSKIINQMDTLITDRNYRFYLGYSGWAPGQLESELLRGDWYLWYPQENYIFMDNSKGKNIWNELILKVTAIWAKM